MPWKLADGHIGADPRSLDRFPVGCQDGLLPFPRVRFLMDGLDEQDAPASLQFEQLAPSRAWRSHLVFFSWHRQQARAARSRGFRFFVGACAGADIENTRSSVYTQTLAGHV